MSALGRRAISSRAAEGVLRSPIATPTSQYGRNTTAYRRISTQVLGLNRGVATRQTSTIPVILRSRLSIPQYSAISSSVSFRRTISYRDIRAGKDPEKDAKKSPRPDAGAKAEPKNTATAEEPEPEGKSAAEEAYEKVRAESEKQQGPRKEKAEDKEAGDQEGKNEKPPPPPPPHGNKTPWQVFTETLNSEFKASKEWNEGTQQLSGSIHDFTQNPNVQKARTAYTKATDTAATASTAALKSTASVIGSTAAWTWDTTVVKGVRKTVGAVGSGLDKATKPVRDTEAYKNVKEVIDDGSSSRYGGWVEKEERRKKREALEAREVAAGRRRPAENLEEDPEAGTNITLHKDAKWKESWREFRDSSKTMQRLFSLKSTYNESENPLITTARSISDRVAGFFAENETAMVIKKFREMDPGFQLEPFLQEMREYILPEVLDAYVKGDIETLKLWLSAAQFQVYAALMKQYTQHGLKSDGRILDIRNVDILNARMLEPGDIPVFVIMCRTQEVHVYRNAKTGQLASGMEDKVQQVTYAIGITRTPEDVNNPETRGWRLIELQKSGRDYI